MLRENGDCTLAGWPTTVESFLAPGENITSMDDLEAYTLEDEL